jgi:hypothetical protein
MARKIRDYRAFLDPPREDIYTFISSRERPYLMEERERFTEQGHLVVWYLKRDGVPELRSRYCCFFDKAHEKYLAPYKKLVAQVETGVLYEQFRYSLAGFNLDEREDLWDVSCDDISINLYKNGRVSSDGGKLVRGNIEMYQYEKEITYLAQPESKQRFHPRFIGFAVTNYVWRSIWDTQLPGLRWLHCHHEQKSDAIEEMFVRICNLDPALSENLDLDDHFNTDHALTLRFPDEAPGSSAESPLRYVFGVLPIFHIAHVLAWTKTAANTMWHQRELNMGSPPSATTDEPHFPLFYALLQKQ